MFFAAKPMIFFDIGKQGRSNLTPTAFSRRFFIGGTNYGNCREEGRRT
nr:MAG TPA: hypothetical protein [Caudoviricetes sp.]